MLLSLFEIFNLVQTAAFMSTFQTSLAQLVVKPYLLRVYRERLSQYLTSQLPGTLTLISLGVYHV